MRNKKQQKEERLTHLVRTRVTETTHQRLMELKQNSNCSTLGEVARKILSREKIACFYIDVTMNAPMEELATIRKELKAIGININQQTRYFHTSKNDTQRSFYFMKTAALYNDVDLRVNRLLDLVGKMSMKWLQGS
ncbi:hypothetical protein ASE74_24160 [Pedobacter sp. Leaf216]|uniref:hypothetical protein n=1 Tax=Pedobacter sp. Leaf216 TaxID=1735684 RepID=UPI0006FA235C|nr:hypothetical protein [Pedobacter sp. Leaf216]KQM68213.1 hypothetical protein ASE74_24160 [Pedobacter sp. Leaf216]